MVDDRMECGSGGERRIQPTSPAQTRGQGQLMVLTAKERTSDTDDVRTVSSVGRQAFRKAPSPSNEGAIGVAQLRGPVPSLPLV